MADCVAGWRQSDTDWTVIDWSTPPSVGTHTLFGNFFGNNGLISLEKNFRAKFANDVIFNM